MQNVQTFLPQNLHISNICTIFVVQKTKGKDSIMAYERKYRIAGCGSGLYVKDMNDNKVFHGTYAECRSELYRLMGWAEPKRWKF